LNQIIDVHIIFFFLRHLLPLRVIFVLL